MPEQTYTYIIIGAGLAGASAVEGIREMDKEGSILLIGSEKHLPYDRPPLTKKLWFDKKKVEDIFVHDRNFYDQSRVTLATGVIVTSLDPKQKTVTTNEGRKYSFGKLLFATGGTPRTLPIPGGNLDGIFYFRTLDDYLRLKNEAAEGKKAVVIGGGFIGSEIAAALAMNKVNVTMIFPEGWLVSRVFPESLGKALIGQYRSRGISVLSGEKPRFISRKGKQFVTVTDSGKQIESDVVIAGVGIAPSLDIPNKAGLKTANGIIVDEHLQTSHPDIFAAGDVAFFPYRALDMHTRVEHWDNALNQGKQAGRNMAGAHEPYNYMPYFFSDLFEFGYEAVGEVDARLETFCDWRKENDTGVIYYLRDGRVRGAMMCNVWEKVDAARSLIQKGQVIAKEHLRGLILERPRERRIYPEVYMKLEEQNAKPIPKGSTPLSRKEAEDLLRDVPDWSLLEGAIEREFSLKDFHEAMDFVNRTAEVANEQDHHPDITISYNKVRLTFTTHKIGGLSVNDFIVAAKINPLFEGTRIKKAA